jgi:hydrogenase maturation protease
MKPVLVIGLGNTLMGDDGVGCVVAVRLAADPRLPCHVEVLEGGSDLLRFVDEVQGRERVIVVDAVLEPGSPGKLASVPDADERQPNAHQLSAPQAAQLLGLATGARIELLGISVDSVLAGEGLSPLIEASVPAVVDHLLQEVSGSRA